MDAEDLHAVGRVLSSGYLAQGDEVRAFEQEVATYIGVRGGVATSSGTAALHLALLTLGVGPGADVLVPSFSCVALLHAVHLTGAEARLVDCGPGDVNMWVDDARRQLTAATKAIIVPYMFGRVVEVDAFRALGVPIVENCAQALGATINGRPVGSRGDVTVLSFYATKMITTGEGGMLLSPAEELLRDARDLRDYDKRPTYRLRFNYKMTDLQAALGRAQLRRLPRFVGRRQEIARRYQEVVGGRVPVFTAPRDTDACYRFVLGVQDVDGFIAGMGSRGIECARPVFRPLHEYGSGVTCPHATQIFRSAVSVPLYPSLGSTEVDRVVARLDDVLAHIEPAGKEVMQTAAGSV